MHRLPQDKLPQEDRNYLIRLGLDERSQMARGLSEKAAKKNLEEKWTTYVEEKYGSREVMGEGGLVKVDDGGKCTVEADDDDDDDESGETEDDGKVETEDDGEVETEDEVEEAPVATNRNVASAQEELAAEFARDAPDVGQKDVRLCEMMNELTTKIVRFGKMFNKKHFRATPAEFLDGLLRKENEQLIRYIGCLAMGGKNGRAGWEELVNMPATREALVCGIMGRALKEHIFSDLYFGASEQLKLDLIDKEKTMRDDDGESSTLCTDDACIDHATRILAQSRASEVDSAQDGQTWGQSPSPRAQLDDFAIRETTGSILRPEDGLPATDNHRNGAEGNHYLVHKNQPLDASCAGCRLLLDIDIQG